MLLDAYALIAFLAGEPAGDEVEPLLRDRDDTPAITAVNIAEVVDRMARTAGHDPAVVVQQVANLRNGGMEVLAMDAFDGAGAGSFRNRFYDRKHAPLSLADCFVLIAALRYGHTVATSDAVLARTANEIGLTVLGLPDSSGVRPDPG